MTTLTMPRLTAGGVELDTSPGAFGALRRSDHLLHDTGALQARMEEDGYLFLPGLLDRDEVLAARRALTDRLATEGHLDPAHPAQDAVARPGSDLIFRPDLALRNPALDRVLYSGAMMDFYARFFGEPVRHYDFTWLRAAAPGKNSSPHADIVYMGRGTFDVLTAWTPLGDIPMDHGGLIVLEGSHHRRDAIADYLSRDVDAYCVNGANAAQIEGGERQWEWDGVLDHDAADLRRRLGGRWLSADFRMGDLLTFTLATVHASLDNHSDRIRLSSDSRYQ
ncbi:MAG: phytanoyl-CoA dioxygenase family protein, partial [Armatimonadetes bacterium]|nr:phytanoyl-CoA dioxygenase family protein [Armatimonadota bacterium]